MANAKTYNELNTTSAVNSTDKVALAQADKTELVTTTVSDLANAVGELNQAGALAELSLATSIGKNLLAQRLNEKGVQNITPNNTLIEMADAVDKLQTTESAQLLKDNIITNVQNDVYANTLSLQPFSACRLPNAYTAIYAVDKIYISKTFGEYNSISDVLNNAEMSISVHTPGSLTRDRAYITCSRDGKTIITHAFDTAGTVDIYDVDYATKQLTYVKSITGVTLYNNTCHMAIKNDRSLIAWYKSWDSGTFIAKVDDLTVISDSLNANASGQGSTLAFDEDTDTLYIYAKYSDSIYLHTVNYTYTGDAITFTKTAFRLPYSSASQSYELDKNSLLLFSYPRVEKTDCIDQQSSSDGRMYGTFRVKAQVADIKKSILEFVETTFYLYTFYNTSGTYASANRHRPIIACITTTDNDTYAIQFLYPACTVTFTKSTSKLSSTQIFNKEIEAQDVWGNMDNPTPFIGLGVNLSSSFWVSSMSSDGQDFSSYSQYRYISQITQTPDKKLIGFKRTINDQTAYYIRQYFLQADIESGKFDLTTKQVEIPADN